MAENQIFVVPFPEFDLDRVLRVAHPQPPPEGTARFLLYLEACGTSERSERLTRFRR